MTMITETLPREGFRFSTSRMFDRAYDLWARHFWLHLGLTLFTIIVFSVFAAIPGLSFIFQLILMPLFLMGFMNIFDKAAHGERAVFADFFRFFSSRGFGKLIPVYLLFNLMVVIGLVLLVIPGIYLGVAMVFALPFAAFRNMSIGQAFDASRKMAACQWWNVLGVIILMQLLSFLGLFIFFIGLIIMWPYLIGVYYAMFEDMVGNTRQGDGLGNMGGEEKLPLGQVRSRNSE
jgi:hypothetical protein